ncbi:RDD family protein [Streptomyces sp. MJP52]|uniref:RDD family protein n=1 Tax=Streptomyces sp. MJP52 TaxID=2940555 RepID=UPI0024737FAB|nr:RDD family protein [Streptomyces sp. MJP52]MDH6226643.1 putative RDD family membrane protein YckC [Streptomyces sp. MJP52]
MDQLVTGEAVALEVRPAQFPSRALAVVLDLLVALFAWFVVLMLLFATLTSVDEAAAAAISVGTFLLIPIGAPIAVETLSRGRSLGKLALGLRVVRDDGGPIGFRHALVRGLLGMVEVLMTFGVVACIASLVSARGRRLGDVFAGTLVVRERVPDGHVRPTPPPPPWLMGRYSGLDLSAVPDGLWLELRQYLTRLGQLDPAVGHAMAQRLATEVVARTGARVEGVPAPQFLAAVLYERQSREAARAQAAALASARARGTVAGGPYVPPGPAPAPAAPAPVPPVVPVSPAAPAGPAASHAPTGPGGPAGPAAPADGGRPGGGFAPPV